MTVSKYTRTLVFVLVLFTCLQACTSQNKTKENQTIHKQRLTQNTVHWLGQWYGEGKKETLIRETAREFELLNQDLDVDLKFPYQAMGIDSFADPFRHIADSLLRWVKEDRWPYDLVLCDKWFYSDVATALGDKKWGEKYLVDFKKEPWYADAHKEYVLQANDYTDNFGGIAPGAFLEGSWNLLYASSAVEEKLGIKVKDNDMTIDDFIDYARVVNNYNQTHSDKITFCATNYISMETVINQLVLSELGNGENQNKNKLDCLSNVYKKLEALSQYKANEQYYNYSTDRELLQEKALFHLHASWVTMFWQRTNQEGLKLVRPCELPSMKGKTAYAYSGTYNAVFVVPKKAKNKEAAIRLTKFICSLDVAEKWENYSKCPTGLKTRISLNEFGSDGFSLFSKHITDKYDNRLVDKTLQNIISGNNAQNINFHALDVLNGQMSAARAISSIQSQLKI